MYKFSIKVFPVTLALITVISVIVEAQQKLELRDKTDGVVCKIMTGNAATATSAARMTTDLATTKIILKEN